MLTVVAILLLPAVLGMALFRLIKIPQALWQHKLQFNRRFLVIAAFAFGLTYLLLLAYTGLIIYTITRAIVSPPNTIYEVFSLAKVSVGYPFIYLSFEWATYHCVKPSLNVVMTNDPSTY